MAIAHECLTRVDLHEVGDLLARTNSLVQLHNLDGGSQVTPSQSRRHHSPKDNRWCVDDELLALVLKMIVSPTLNSLSQIWILCGGYIYPSTPSLFKREPSEHAYTSTTHFLRENHLLMC